MKVKVSNITFSSNEVLVGRLLEEFPDAEVNALGVRLKDEKLIEYFENTDAAIVGLEHITPDLLDRLPRLKMVAKYGVGLDNINITACQSRNVEIGWTGGVNKRSVAEMTLGFMLALLRNLYSTSNDLKNLTWNKNGGTQLTGKTVGIIGLGNIGKEVVSLLGPFNCRILVNDIVDIHDFAKSNNLQEKSKEEIFRESDIVSIHVPLTPDTKYLVDEEALKRMKKSSVLINTARGGLVDEEALKNALLSKMIAGAALDVYEVEPPTEKEFLSIPNLLNTPHTGGNSSEAVIAMGMSAIEHLVRFRNERNTTVE